MTVMAITITCNGRTPLLMHNPRMVDPNYELSREIKALTAKRKKTDRDLKEIEKFEWYGGLYTEMHDGKEIVVQPTSKLRKCLINTAKIFKLGAAVGRAITFNDLNVPLAYDGPEDIDKLFANVKFHSRLSVGIGKKRVMRVRPQFLPWRMAVEGTFIEDAGLNYGDLERIVALSGQVERIGDNRVNGYGRFDATIERG